MEELLSHAFVRHAALSLVCLSALSATVGTYVVVRRRVFAAGGISHASFGGVGLACFLGLDPTLGALLFAMATALALHVTADRGHLRHDSAIAMLWSLGMALGIIFISLTPGYTPNLLGFMFGDVLAVGLPDVLANAAAAAACLALTMIFYRPLMYTAFDEQYAQVAGWHPRRVELCADLALALAIALSIKAVGIILVLSVFTMPQALALTTTRRLSTTMLVAGLIALAASLAGLALSFAADLPTGAVITTLLALALIIVKLAHRA